MLSSLSPPKNDVPDRFYGEQQFETDILCRCGPQPIGMVELPICWCVIGSTVHGYCPTGQYLFLYLVRKNEIYMISVICLEVTNRKINYMGHRNGGVANMLVCHWWQMNNCPVGQQLYVSLVRDNEIYMILIIYISYLLKD